MALARNGDVELFWESFGPEENPTLLLINGLGSQCVNYEVEWCEMFVARGLRVIRFDNRDVGLSTKLVDAGSPPYLLRDMALDAIAVLDAAGVARAHVMGLSMGGMIAQTLAIEHADRLVSLTSVMSTTGEAGYGAPDPAAMKMLLAPRATDRAAAIAASVAGMRVWATPAFADEDRWSALAERAYDRCNHPGGVARQIAAVGASGSRADGLRGARLPTLVMHGSEDKLIGPSGGERTAALIPGARFELIEGMGHDYPPPLWPRWVDLVASHVLASQVEA